MTSLETRTRLLETALELIWQSNYTNVGVNDICNQAGVTKGSFYHHFESKAALFCEAANYYWSNMKRQLDPLFSPSHSSLEQLENFIDFIQRTKLGDPDELPGCVFFGSGALCGTGEEKVQQALQCMSTEAVKYNLALVRALAADNYLESNAEQEQTARIMHEYIQGVMNYGRIHSNRECLRRDLQEGIYRLVQLKREYWYSAQPSNLSEIKQAGIA